MRFILCAVLLLATRTAMAVNEECLDQNTGLCLCTCQQIPPEDFIAYELKNKVGINKVFTVTTPFTTGTVQLTKTHRLLVPAAISPNQFTNPDLHFLGVEADAASYDTNTTPQRTFATSLGMVTFNPGSIVFFYDPTSKSLNGLPPAPPAANPMLCFTARPGSKGPKPDLTTTDQFGTQHPSLIGVDYACVSASLSGPAPTEQWLVCFRQRTRDALNPPNVFLTTQDLGTFSDIDVDPLDEVCVPGTVQ